MFLKIGQYTINEQAIAYIDWGNDKMPISICLSVTVGDSTNVYSERLIFPAQSQEAKALREYYSGSRAIDLIKWFDMSQAIKG